MLQALPGQAAPAASGVRLVLFLPADKVANTTLTDNIRRITIDLQEWSRKQLGGKTFSIASSDVEVCKSSLPERYFQARPWDTISEELSKCVPWKYNDPDYTWVVYAAVLQQCGTQNNIGAGTTGITIMGQGDVDGLSGAATGVNECKHQWQFEFDRWTGGLGHELGHAMGLPHPPGCDQQLPSCDHKALMSSGMYDYPNTYLREDDKAALSKSPFYSVNGIRTEDRLFNWAEASYPTLFSNRGRVMLSAGGYYYREYPQSGNWLAIKDGRVYAYGTLTQGQALDLGTVESFLPQVTRDGF
ncbi:hypothetical protein [Chitinimonas sp.]|uniref:hypothetical protein n=1 Tax=Chitinimonas sp. TaxID=1934313 RepID=UPI0035AEC393